MRLRRRITVPEDLRSPSMADHWPDHIKTTDPYGVYLAYTSWLRAVREWEEANGTPVPLEEIFATPLIDWVSAHEDAHPGAHLFEPENPYGAVLIGPQHFPAPTETIGWDVLGWAAVMLLQPDGENSGDPLVFTREQVNFLLNYYAVDARGRFRHPNAVLRRLKGWGKDPMIAAQACMELCGPVRYAGRDEHGRPVGKPVPQPWVVIAAVSKDQTRSVMRLFAGMMSDAMVDAYGLDIKQEIIHKAGGGQIEAISSSSRAAEGIRGTWTAINESHHWLENNEGHAMARVLTRNAVKTKARYVQFTNSHNPGENSVAEQAWLLYEDVQAGKAHDVGVLYDSREAPPDTRMVDPETGEADLESIRRGVLAARGDSVWVNVDGMVGEILDVRTTEAEARRFYLNQICPEATSWIAPFEWDARRNEALTLEPGDEITLGFDGSLSDDNTALTACRVSDGAIFPLKVWGAPKGAKNWTVPREEVDAYVRNAFETYRVVGGYFDRAFWESYLDAWTVAYGRRMRVRASQKNPLEFDMRARKRDFAAACETFLDAVLNGDVTHNGDPVLRQHVLNAQRRPYQGYVGIAKEHRESPRKIDAAVTAVLAFAARQEYLKSRKGTGKRKVVLY